MEQEKYKKMYETLLERNNKLMEAYNVLERECNKYKNDIQILEEIRNMHREETKDNDEKINILSAQVKYYQELLIKTLHHFVKDECFIDND